MGGKWSNVVNVKLTYQNLKLSSQVTDGIAAKTIKTKNDILLLK